MTKRIHDMLRFHAFHQNTSRCTSKASKKPDVNTEQKIGPGCASGDIQGPVVATAEILAVQTHSMLKFFTGSRCQSCQGPEMFPVQYWTDTRNTLKLSFGRVFCRIPPKDILDTVVDNGGGFPESDPPEVIRRTCGTVQFRFCHLREKWLWIWE